MARRAVPVFPAMVVAIPLVIGIAAVSTSHQAGQRTERERVDAASQVFAAPSPHFGDSDCVLNGEPRSIVVVGSSLSYVWPRMLQDMLDDHAGRRLYTVNNAVVSASPVRAWISEPTTQEYESTFGAMRRDFFKGDESSPTIALCQQTLQETLTPRGPVASMADKEGIRIGADALERLASMLHDEGVERVYFAMHTYKQGAEPHVGNERLALRSLLERDHDYVFEGPDVWSATIGAFPDAFGADGVHLNQRGMKLLAEAWYRTLAGSQTSQAIIDRMHARDYDVEAVIRAYRQSRLPG